MSNTVSQAIKKSKKIHPQKFALWIAIGSIIMMFGGFTSGYIVRRSQGNWELFDLPIIFWISTATIIISSITMTLAINAYKKSKFGSFKGLLILSCLLGIAFSVMQLVGFQSLTVNNIKVAGNPAGSFIYVIAGVHLLHIIGGVLALLYQIIKNRKHKFQEENLVGLQIVATYWHFVDILWLYLFFFFMFFR